MSLIGWTGAPALDGESVMFSNEVAPEYEIRKEKDDRFFVHRLVTECPDAGPYASFKDAETAVLKMIAILVCVEEQAWVEMCKGVPA